MLPQIKIYEIDYDFILKNYTSPELWDKVWNLFVFKNYVFTLTLQSINVKKKQIKFNIKLSSDLDIYWNHQEMDFDYDLQNMNIKMLKKLINANMLHVVEHLEQEYIEKKDEMYLFVENSRADEIEILREIASNFLDENGVTNSEIRDVYIDNYVDNNEKNWEQLQNVKRNKQYTYLVDLYLILSHIFDDKDLEKKVLNAQTEDVSDIENEVKEYMKQLEDEEFIDGLKCELEAI